MSKHHDELAIQFELLLGVQKELKESFDIVQSNWQNKHECPCLTEIDRWEEEILNRVRQVAAKARTTANEMMTKNMLDIRRRLDQLAFDIEQRQNEGNYLDNDIAEVKKQLEQLNNNIQHAHNKIRINRTKQVENRHSLPEYHCEEEDEDRQENIWTNFRKLIKSKYASMDYRNNQSTFKRNTTASFEPIVLTSFDSSTRTSSSQRNSYSPSESTMSQNCQWRSFANDESLNDKNFVSIDHDRQLPQASDA